MGNILVKMRNDGKFTKLTTYDREHGVSPIFYLSTKKIEQWNRKSALYDSDGDQIIRMYFANDKIKMEVFWVRTYETGIITGYKQSFAIPIEEFYEVEPNMLDESEYGISINPNIKYLCREDRFITPSIDFSRAQRVLSNIISDKLTRRALSKCLRDYFRWSGDKITLYNDGKFDFYFVCSGAWSIEGGVILHYGTKKTRDGEHEYVYFGIHT